MFSFSKKSGAETAPAAPAAGDAGPSWRERLVKGLAKTRAQWGGKLKSIFSRGKIDDELLEELEPLLLTGDVGVEATDAPARRSEEARRARQARDAGGHPDGARRRPLARPCSRSRQPLDVSGHKPFVIMMAGVNGAGKTTSIGKLAKHFQDAGQEPCCSPPATPSAPPRASS